MNWLASFLIIIGYLFIVYKWPIGFLIQIAGCFIYGYLYFGIDYAVVLINTVFVLINGYGYYKWKYTTNTG